MNYKHLIAKNIIAGNANPTSSAPPNPNQASGSSSHHVSPQNQIHQRGHSHSNSMMVSVPQKKQKPTETDSRL